MTSAEEMDAQMGQPPMIVRKDGTRIYTAPMIDGRIRVTYLHPDGTTESFKAIPGPLNRQLADKFSLFTKSEEESFDSMEDDEIETPDFAARMEAKFASLRKTPEQHRNLVLTALRRLEQHAPDWLSNPNLCGQDVREALQKLDGILAACPLEVRSQVGGYIQVNKLVDDASRRTEIERRVLKIRAGLKKWLDDQRSSVPSSNFNRINETSSAKQHIGAAAPGNSTKAVDERRKLVLGAGLLVICFGSMIEGFGNRHGTPSIAWLVVLAATWAVCVWMWPTKPLQIRRKVLLWKKRRLRVQRMVIATLLKSNHLSEDVFESIINKGMTGGYVELREGCAKLGWRRMSIVELRQAESLLEVYLADRNKSIRRLEKLLLKKVISENELLKMARERKPHAPDWRCMNWGELKMMITFVTNDEDGFLANLGK